MTIIQKIRRKGGHDQRYGELEVSTCNFTMYVDPDGDDTGDVGDADHPFATVTRAMQRVPSRVAHRVILSVAGGDYPAGAWPAVIDNTLEPGGTLAIGCPDAPVDHLEEEFEIATVEELNGGGVVLSVSGAAWTEHALSGYWIQGEDTEETPFLLAIATNDEDTITLRPTGGTYELAEGVTFRVVRPAAQFTMEEAPIFKVQNHDAETGCLEEESFARFALAGIRLDCSGVDAVQQWAIEGNSSSIYAQCVQLIGNVDGYGSHIRDCAVNVHLPDMPSVLARYEAIYPGCSAVNTGPGLCLCDADDAAGLYYATYGDAHGVNGLVVAGIMDFLGCSIQTGVKYSSVYQIDVAGGTSMFMFHTLMLGIGDPDVSPAYIGSVTGPAEVSCYECYSRDGSHAYHVSNGSLLQLTDCDCDPVGIVGAAVKVESGGRAIPTSLSHDLLGATGAYNNDGSDVAAWPDEETTITGGEQVVSVATYDASIKDLDERVTALEGGGSHPTIADLTADGWAWDNQGASTMTDVDNGVAFDFAPSAALNAYHLIANAPDAPYRLTIGFDNFLTIQWSIKSLLIGWKAASGAAAKMECYQYDLRDYGSCRYIHLLTQTGWVEGEAALATQIFEKALFLRVENDGTNITASVSLDGVTWMQVLTHTIVGGYLEASGYPLLVFGAIAQHATEHIFTTVTYYSLEEL